MLGVGCCSVGRNKLRPSHVRTPRAEGGAGTSRAGPMRGVIWDCPARRIVVEFQCLVSKEAE